jgi:hypothetical protein
MVLCAALAGPAHAIETTFIGDGSWGDAANWSNGVPNSPDTVALLSHLSHSRIDSGSFGVSRVTGFAFFTLAGGELALHQPGSALYDFAFTGGRLAGPGGITVQSLAWEGGSLDGPQMTVTGNARLKGALQANGGRLELNGVSTTSGPQTTFNFTGPGAMFAQRGSLSAQPGTQMQFNVTEGAAWVNSGLISVHQGGLHSYAGTITQNGTIDIRPGGNFVVDHNGSDSMLSLGTWHIREGSTLSFVGVAAWHDFEAGTVHNDGVLRAEASSLGNVVRFGPAATLQGTGGLDIRNSLVLYENAQPLQLGWVRLATTDQPYPEWQNPPLAELRTTAGLTVDKLEYWNGKLSGGGTVTVNGVTELYGAVTHDPYADHGAPEKLMAGTWNFNGDVHWDGEAHLRGGGTFNVGAGATFHDVHGYDRTSAAVINNHGTYLKGGGGRTYVGTFNNDGRLHVVDSATLHTSALQQRGVVEVEEGASLVAYRNFVQDEATAATYVAGQLSAQNMVFAQGLFSAGAPGATGQAQLQATQVTFADSVLQLDIASLLDFDLVSIDGMAQLGGELQVLFGDGAPAYGVYRFLTASGGVFGHFDTLSWDDTSYRITALYGSNFVELNVAAVPEPSTWALMLLGLGAAGLRARKAQRERAAVAST